MSYSYGGVSAKDLNDFKIMPEGEHEVFIYAIEERYSKQGRPMVEISFKAGDRQLHDHKIKRYYIMLDNEYTEKNVGRLLAAMGQDPEQGGRIHFADYRGEYLMVSIVHEDDGEYGKQARVKRLISNFSMNQAEDRREREAPRGPTREEPVSRNDDIPF